MSRFKSAGRSKLVAGLLIALALSVIAVAIKQASNRSNTQILVLIATIDGPKGETPEISERIARRLTESLSALREVRVQRLSQAIGEPDGRQKALELGRAHYATIVVWGGMEPGTAFPTVFVENLNPLTVVPFLSVNDYVTEAILVDPDHVSFSGSMAEQGSGVAAFVSGFVRYRRADYAEALDRLTLALNQTSRPDSVSKVLMTRGNVLLASGKADLAVADYARALRINPGLLAAHANRGTALLKLREPAVDDFAQAFQLGQQARMDVNRAAADAARGEHQGAVGAYDRAIQANPEDGVAYLNRGVSGPPWATIHVLSKIFPASSNLMRWTPRPTSTVG